MTSPPPLAPGVVVGGRYRVTGVLASGGMGAVYDAIDERLDRAVALKVILRDLVEDPAIVARFEREARAAARLSHPGIVQVTDLGRTDDGLGYLVMERVAGETLHAIVSRGPLAPRRAADLVEQALGAIAAAHAAGIVHRDLKPGNLMVVPLGAEREAVKLLDFGIARLSESEGYARLTRTGVILGTPSYMAPEQARGARVDARTDVYAMGVILWYLLTGKRPFGGADMAAVVEALLSETPPRADALRPEVPRALATVAERAMRKDPDARFASADEMGRALAALREPGASAASSAAPSSPEAPTAGTVPARPRAAGLASTPLPAHETSTMAAPLVVAAVPREVAPPSAPSRRGVWIGLGLAALLVGACVAGMALVSGAIFVTQHEEALPLPLAGSSGPALAPPLTTTPPSTFPPDTATPQERAIACGRALRCCESLMTQMSGGPEGCELFRDPPPYVRTTRCVELVATYRSMIETRGGDTSACD
ncbi:MAG: serine/threonine protein kinase [Sandaracinaceae bacterium]|nr:serine/threonine protein kinase [Sandaracinaceae bacterium]